MGHHSGVEEMMKHYIWRKQPGTETVLTSVRKPDNMLGTVTVV